jgi:hypothetical protein
MLLRMLERRFDVLPDWARERVMAADSPALEQWGLRFLEAQSIEDVIGQRSAS